jgi:hypothetical protein
MATSTATLIKAMRVLADDIQSDDGIANLAIAEAADRLELFGCFALKIRSEASKRTEAGQSYFEETVKRCNDVLKPVEA